MSDKKSIEVEAIRPCYYEHVRRKVGDRFFLVEKEGHVQNPDGSLEPKTWTAEEQFSKRGMVKVEELEAKKAKGKKPQGEDQPQGRGNRHGKKPQGDDVI